MEKFLLLPQPNGCPHPEVGVSREAHHHTGLQVYDLFTFKQKTMKSDLLFWWHFYCSPSEKITNLEVPPPGTASEFGPTSEYILLSDATHSGTVFLVESMQRFCTGFIGRREASHELKGRVTPNGLPQKQISKNENDVIPNEAP